MPVLFVTENGYKVVYAEGVADNSAGNAAADIPVKLTFGEISDIIDYVAATVVGTGASISDIRLGPSESPALSHNEAQVTVNVPAGAVATIRLVVVGY